MARKKDTRTTSDSVNETQSSKGQNTASADQLRKMIAESAYYRAEQRGFTGGNPVEDWIVAEREIKSQGRSH